jgi:hypothetical protein
MHRQKLILDTSACTRSFLGLHIEVIVVAAAIVSGTDGTGFAELYTKNRFLFCGKLCFCRSVCSVLVCARLPRLEHHASTWTGLPVRFVVFGGIGG